MKKQVLTLILAVLFLSCLNVKAQHVYDFSAINQDGDTLYYTITSSMAPYTVEVACCGDTSVIPAVIIAGQYAQLTYCHDYDSIVSIPSTVVHGDITYTVTGIGQKAFCCQRDIQTVILPSTIDSIGLAAFAYSTLTNITIPSASYIGGAAFFHSQISDINLPANLTALDYCAFADDYLLTSINIPGGVSVLKALTFDGCSNLRHITFNEGLSIIEDALFQSCGWPADTLVFPSSLKYLGSVGGYPIAASATRYVEFQNNEQHPDDTLWLADDCLSNFSSLSTLNLSDNIRHLGVNCFSGCSSLTSITLPAHLQSIPSLCFAQCTSLSDVILPQELDSIAGSAFAGCTALKHITIPSQVRYIGNYAFEQSLLNGEGVVTMLNETPPTLANKAFYDLNNPLSILFNIPCHTTTAYTTAPEWSTYNTFSYHEDCVSVDEYGQANNVKIYPVPAGDLLHLETGEQFIRQVELYDAFGRLVFSQSFNDLSGQLNLSGLHSGMYFIKVVLENSAVTTSKIVKQ